MGSNNDTNCIANLDTAQISRDVSILDSRLAENDNSLLNEKGIVITQMTALLNSTITHNAEIICFHNHTIMKCNLANKLHSRLRRNMVRKSRNLNTLRFGFLHSLQVRLPLQVEASGIGRRAGIPGSEVRVA